MQVFYTPAKDGKAPQVIDGAHEFNGQTVGLYSHETLAQLAVRYPGIMLGDADEVMSQREAMLTTAPEQITREQFIDALEALMPVGWTSDNGCESFKFSECFSGRITSIYVRDGDTYWTFMDVGTKPHAKIMEKVRRFTEKTWRKRLRLAQNPGFAERNRQLNSFHEMIYVDDSQHIDCGYCIDAPEDMYAGYWAYEFPVEVTREPQPTAE